MRRGGHLPSHGCGSRRCRRWSLDAARPRRRGGGPDRFRRGNVPARAARGGRAAGPAHSPGTATCGALRGPAPAGAPRRGAGNCASARHGPAAGRRPEPYGGLGRGDRRRPSRRPPSLSVRSPAPAVRMAPRCRERPEGARGTARAPATDPQRGDGRSPMAALAGATADDRAVALRRRRSARPRRRCVWHPAAGSAPKRGAGNCASAPPRTRSRATAEVPRRPPRRHPVGHSRPAGPAKAPATPPRSGAAVPPAPPSHPRRHPPSGAAITPAPAESERQPRPRTSQAQRYAFGTPLDGGCVVPGWSRTSSVQA